MKRGVLDLEILVCIIGIIGMVLLLGQCKKDITNTYREYQKFKESQ